MQHIFIPKLSDTDAWCEKIHNIVKIGREYTENLKNGEQCISHGVTYSEANA